MTIAYSPRLLARLDDAMIRARAMDVALPAWTGGGLVAAVVLITYYVERVEGIHSLRLPLAFLFALAWWGRAMLLGRASRAVARKLWDAPPPEDAGRAVDVLRTSMVLGLGLWTWSWLLVLGSLGGPIGVAVVLPLFILRGAVAPSWIARSACEADAGFRGLWRAVKDNDTRRAYGVATELLVLLGTVGLTINLYATTAVVMLFLRSFGGLEVASLEAFLSLSNTFVLLAIVCAAVVLVEPLRAALSAFAYVDARVRAEGLDLRASIQEAIDHSNSRRGVARAAAVIAVILAGSLGASAIARAQYSTPGDPGPTPIVEPSAEDRAVEADVDEILARPEFREFEEQRGLGLRHLIERLFEWLLRQDAEAPQVDAPNLGAIVLPGAWFFILIAIGLLLAVAVYLIATMKRDGKVKGAANAAVVPIDPRERPPSSFLDEAARLAEAGDLREALRALYLATLVSLDRRRMIAFDPHLTNWQYMRQLPRGTTRDSFGQFTRVFDHKWYGEESTTHADYERCRGLAREIVGAE
jgi:hypothetical protein